MPDEMTMALQEIASLLRRRVEQQDESARRSAENMARIDARQPATDRIESIRKDGEERRTKMMAQMEEKNERAQQEKERLREEDREFKKRLLAELERHNALLERLLSRAEG